MKKTIGGAIALAVVLSFANTASATNGKWICVDNQSIFVLYSDMWQYEDTGVDFSYGQCEEWTTTTPVEEVTTSAVSTTTSTIASTTTSLDVTTTVTATTAEQASTVGAILIPAEVQGVSIIASNEELPATGQEDTIKLIIAGATLIVGIVLILASTRKRVHV